jgi:DNA replication licensing factor MCM4
LDDIIIIIYIHLTLFIYFNICYFWLFLKKLLADYISFARLHIHPKITDEAAQALVEGYVDMRMVGNSVNHARNKKLITATPRQLEAIIRLAEAHARLHYRLEVGREDVTEAVRLMNVATQRAATDPTTGTIDMDMITTGQTATGRQLIAALMNELKTMLSNKFRGKAASFIEIQRSMESDTVTVNGDDLEEALRQLSDTGLVQWTESSRLWRVAEVFA